MFVSRTHRATRKNWSDLRSNEDGSEKNSARNSISPVIPTANRFHFLPASLATSAPTPLESIARARDETKTRLVENAKCFALIILPRPCFTERDGQSSFSNNPPLFLPVNLINAFVADSFLSLSLFFNCIKLFPFDSLERTFKDDIEN